MRDLLLSITFRAEWVKARRIALSALFLKNRIQFFKIAL
jgi:hypothetical protein